MSKEKIFTLTADTKEPSAQIQKLLSEFRRNIETLESKTDISFPLFQDGKSEAYYIDCHILASNTVDVMDYEASLDPEEQEDFKANRTLLPFHKLFLKMQDDAKNGRQFNDIIVEYSPDGINAERPLKIYGGQHRAKSIENASKNLINRYHGFRVYLGLTVNQRNDIAQISNANINVPIDLLDRMQETVIGPELRNWCKKVGLVSKDFAERKNNDGIITARLARTFVVNFQKGKDYVGEINSKAFVSLTGNEANDFYLKLDNKERIKILKDNDLFEAGKSFAILHKKQMSVIKKDKELSKTTEFKTKAITLAVISAWAFAAGLLLRDGKRLTKLYSLSSTPKGDPLAAKEMSEYKHQSDEKTYRGLGTRSGKKECGKIIELFLLYSQKSYASITNALIDGAVTSYLSYALEEEKTKKLSKLK